jgi:hypothetical protein
LLIWWCFIQLLSFPEPRALDFEERKKKGLSGMVVLVCNPSTQDAEAEASQVPGQSGLHTETMSQKRKIIFEIT